MIYLYNGMVAAINKKNEDGLYESIWRDFQKKLLRKTNK